MKRIFLLSMLMVTLTISAQQTSLEAQFLNPPTTVRPYVWWHWMGSNFSKSGITKDLEAMKEMGIGGATIFNLTSAVQESHAPTLNNPWPDQTYRSPAYWDAMQHAASEAKRLGLEIGLHNTVGYSTTGGPWIDEERSMQQLVWSDTTVTGMQTDLPHIFLNVPKIVANEGWGAAGRKLSYFRDVVVLAIPADKKILTAADVKDLTAFYDPNRGLNWKVPVGEMWTIYRMCHASLGRPPHPVPDELVGKTLEADKMSAEQTIFHWNQVLEPVKKYLGEYLGNTFGHMLIDSYEAGTQTWTPNFRNEFSRRKGYDPTPWLLTLGSQITNDSKNSKRRVFGSEELTKRFEWDYRDVVNQMYQEYGFAIGRKMLNDAKLQLQWEPYGGPFDTQQGVAGSDLPMGEFWTHNNGMINANIPAAAAATGKKIVGAEAFTSTPVNSKYTEDPAFLKYSANGAFASGVNRLILHHWVHQPFDDKYQPGMGMGWWGTHFSRHQTWAKSGQAFFEYLGRCQALLQQGETVSEYLCVGDLQGRADVISVNDFLNFKITIDQDNRIVLPSGRTYPFIVFKNNVMLAETVQKIKDLVEAGATVVSPKPTQSPGLQNYPEFDVVIQNIAAEMWKNASENAYKKGFVFTNLEDAKKKFNIQPDFSIEKVNKADAIKYYHRRAEGTDIYFIANMDKSAQQTELSFLVTGKQPEIWQAEDGSIRQAAVWSEKNGRTHVKVNLGSLQTVFVVFRNPVVSSDHLVDIKTNGRESAFNLISNSKHKVVLQAADTMVVTAVYASGKQKTVQLKPGVENQITGDWQVSFVPKSGNPFVRTFDKLSDFSQSTDKEICYFAGTATYSKVITVPAGDLKKGKRIVLDLGELNDLAQVFLNGNLVRTLWYPPYQVDITDFLKKGKNTFEVAVTNNWANRLIGDEKEPADFEWGRDRGEKSGRAMKAYPDWFLKDEARPSQGRKSFSIWYYYRDNSPLQPAGLVGPVKLIRLSEIAL